MLFETKGKGFFNPKELLKKKKKDGDIKKININKNDIVERDDKVVTDDGRELLK